MSKDVAEKTLLREDSSHREGDLYKVVNTFGRTFELRYGYYEECDRQNPLCEPVPLYPDLAKAPIYTVDGAPLVTMMQDACKSFDGKSKRTADSSCAECMYFERGEEWFGMCACPSNRRNE